jgi:RNA polymerase sigma factor (sigma-70 family)
MSMAVQKADEFDLFVLKSRERLIRYTKAITGDGQAAQDIAQETFVRAWQRWSTVREYAQPEAWCRHVAHNLAVGRWRRLKRSASMPHHLATPIAASSDIGHVDVAAAIRALPKGERNAIVMSAVLDMSVREIAQELRVSEGTVKSWLSRGRTRLRRSLSLSDHKTALKTTREDT